MRILLVTHEFPPIITPQSLRWYYLLQNLSKSNNGIRVDVLKPEILQGFPFFNDSVEFDKVAQSEHSSYPGLLHDYLYSKKTPINYTTNSGSPNKKKTSLKKKLSGLIGLKPILIPDKTVEWLPYATLKLLKLIKKENYDVIISSGPPFTSHIICGVATCFKEFKWIADFGDPWTFASDRELPKWRNFIDGQIEKWMFNKMNHAIFTSELTKKKYSSRFCFLNQKSSVIMQGADTSKYDVRNKTNLTNLLVYTGTFYPKIREPWALLEALKSLTEIQLVIVGTMREDIKRFVEDNGITNISFTGQLSHEEAIEWQLKANALIFVDNKFSTQIPGKIFEYLSSNKPVVAVIHDNDSFISELSRKYCNIHVASNNSSSIIEKINEALLYRGGSNGEIEVDWFYRAVQLENLIRSVVEEEDEK